MFKIKHLLFIVLFFAAFNTYSQNNTIAWSTKSSVKAQGGIIDENSPEQIFSINQLRTFLYDSLEKVAAQTGIPFYERSYTFKTPPVSGLNSLIIPFHQATRLIYGIKVRGIDFEQIVYTYGSTKQCSSNYRGIILSIPKIKQTITEIEIFTFTIKGGIEKVGLSNLDKLPFDNFHDYCIQLSYYAQKNPLVGDVNTKYKEVKPLISTDGRTLIFHRQNSSDNMGGKRDDQDIYISRLQNNGKWETVENLGKPLNNKGSNGVTSISPGENKMFLMNEYYKDKTRDGLSYSEKGIEGWSNPSKIKFQDFINYNNYFDYCVSANQLTMILAIEDDHSQGDQDLYVSHFDFTKNQWNKPLNLGDVINTPWAEAAPFLAADGKTLYFASQGQLGYGGFDIYMSKRLDNTWTHWSNPVNLGPIINDENDNLYYTLSAKGDKAYFTSGDKRNQDIYEIELPKLFQPRPVVLVDIHIVDLHTGNSLYESLTIKSLNNPEFNLTESPDSLTGKTRVVLPVNDEYLLSINSESYISISGLYSTHGINEYTESNISIPLINGTITFPFNISTIARDTHFSSINLFYETNIKENSSSTGALASLQPLNGYHTSNSTSTKFEFDIILGIKKPITNNTNNAEIQNEGSQPILINGQLIDVKTLRPVGSQLIYRLNDEVKAVSKSNPRTGRFQVMLFDNTSYSLELKFEANEYKLQELTPQTEEYVELERLLVLGALKGDSSIVQIGTGLYENHTEKEQKLLEKQFNSRKSGKRTIKTIQKTSQLPNVIKEDIKHLFAILKTHPDWNCTISIITPAGFRYESELQNHIIEIIKNPELNITVKTINSDPTIKNKNKKYPKELKIMAKIYF